MTSINLVIIDNNIQDYQTIINSLNSETKYILFDALTDTYDTLKTKISELTISIFMSVGIIQHNKRGSTYSLFRNTYAPQVSTLVNVSEIDPNLDTWSDYSNFIIYLKNEYSMINFDLMACALYSDPNWKYVIDTLEIQTSVNIRASKDDTGSTELGGNWFLETDSVNLKYVYFTDAIDEFKGILSWGYYTILIGVDNNIYGMGYNPFGNLGNNTSTNQTTPVAMNNTYSSKIPKYVINGYYSTMVLMTDNSIYSTGNNAHGHFGNGSQSSSTTLTIMTNSTGKTPKEIALGDESSSVLMTDGTIYSAGHNGYGDLGIGSYSPYNVQQLTNTILPSGKTPKSISRGGQFMIVLMTDGSIFGTGGNQSGQLGLGDLNNRNTLTLMQNSTGKTPKSIHTGQNYCMVLMTDNTIYGTGNNYYGNLGVGSSGNSINSLTLMQNSTGKIPNNIYCGSNHTMVMMTDKTIYGIGFNSTYQLGLGDTNNRLTLTLMTNSTGKTPKSIFCGSSSTMLLMTDGTVYGIGDNQYGQLGLGDTTNRTTLTALSGTYTRLSGDTTNLSNFTIGTKILENGAFIITQPTSTVSTTYGSTWNQLGNTFTGASGDVVSQGYISEDGLTIAFVSYGDDTGGTNRGSVKVYRWINSTWTLLGNPFYGIVDNETFGGISLGIDGNTIAINYLEAQLYTLNTSKKGFTAVFKYNSSKTSGSNDVTNSLFGPVGWSIIGAPIYNESNGENNVTLRLSGNNKIIAIGSPNNDGTSGNINDQRGNVRVYAYDSTKVIEVTDQSNANFGPIGWTRIGVDIDGTKALNNQGSLVELSVDGKIVAIGVPKADDLPSIMEGERFGETDFGHTKVLYWTGSTWAQRGRNIYPQTYSIYDHSVQSPSRIGMSANANVLAIGTYAYASYRGIASTWIWNPISSDYMPLASQLNEFGDWQGSSLVSLSSDGTILANGANDADNNTPNGGTIRVYKLTTKSTTLISSAPSNMSSYISDIDFNNVNTNGTIYRVTITGAITGGTIFGTNIYRHDSNLAMAAVHAGVVANGETKEVYVVMERPQVYLFGTTRLGVTSSNYGPVSAPYPLGSYGSYFFQTEPKHWLKIGNDIFGSTQQFLGSNRLSGDGTKIIAEGSNLMKVFSIDSYGQFSYSSSNLSVAKIYGNIVIPEASGESIITATQSTSGANQENTIIDRLIVNSNSIAPTLSNFTVAALNFGSAPFSLTPPTSNSGGSFTYTSSNTAVATISGSTVTIVGAGSSTITATQAASGSYTTGTITATFTVNQIAPTISNFTVAAQNFGSSPFSLTAPTSNSGGAFTYTSSNTAVANIEIAGINWTSRTSASDNFFRSVAYGNGLWVAVAYTGSGNRVMTSTDGINWTNRTGPVDNDWSSVAYGNGLWVAVSWSGTGNRVMTSPNGINWTSRTSASDNYWVSIAYGNGLWVAVALSGTGNRVMTSPDGINWTSRTSATDNQWRSVAYGNGLWVAVAFNGTGNRVMTSPDGINWTSRTSAADNYWRSVAYGDVLWVAVAESGANKVMTSPDGINWTSRTSAAQNQWTSVAYGNGIWVAVSESGGGNRVMTSSEMVTIVGAGSSTITATQASTTNYTSGNTSTLFTVNPIAPTLSNFTVAARNFGSSPFSLTAPTSNSGGAFTYTSSNTSVATISGSTVTVVNAGSTTITATQASTTNYTSGTITATFTVNQIAPTISNFTVAAQNFGSSPFSLTAPTSNSGGAFTYTSSNTGVATISGSTVTVVGAGSSTITATQASTTNYTSGTITATFVVNPIAPTISNFTVAAQNFGSSPFSLTAPTSNSGGAFTYTSSNTGVATISGSTVTVVGAGSSTITATQASTTNYTSGTITATFTVNPIAPTISNFTVTAQNFGSSPFSLTAPTSNSGGAFTYTSSNTAVATISGSTVTVVGAGSSTITATQASTTNYTSGTITATFVVNPIAPTLSNFSMPAKNFGDSTFNIITNVHTSFYIRTGGSDWTNSIINNDTSNTNIQYWNPDVQWYDISYDNPNRIASQFRFFAAYVTKYYNITSGSTNVFTGNGNIGTYSFTYNGGTSYTGTFTGYSVGPQSWNYTLPVSVNVNTLVPTSNSGGSYAYTSSNTSVATVSGNTITIVGGGSSTITATQAATTNYTSGAITATFTVNPIAPTISNFTVAAKNYGSSPFTLTAPTSNSGGSFTYTSSNTSVATISGSTITVINAGSSTITATQAATANYISGTVVATFTVNPIAPSLVISSPIATDFILAQNSFNQVGQSLTIQSLNVDGYFAPSIVKISEDGTKMAVGGIGGDNKGIVRMYSLTSGSWTQIGGDILGTNGGGYAGFGFAKGAGSNAISISSDGTLLTTVETGLSNPYQTRFINVFKYDASKTVAQNNSSLANYGPINWSRMTTISVTATYDYTAGAVISADGKTIAVSDGTLRMYRSEDNGVTWTQRGSSIVDPANGMRQNNQGFSNDVSISSNGLTVLAATNPMYSGGVNAQFLSYDWDGTNWNSSLVREFSWGVTISNAISSDASTCLVTISNNSYNNGNIYRYSRVGLGSWTLINNMSTPYWFYSVSISNNAKYLSLTRPQYNVSDFGDVEVYYWDGTTNNPIINNRNIKNRTLDIAYEFNASLSSNGSRLAVGGTGKIDVYDLNGTPNYIKIYDDPAFRITATSSNSTGTITYTSSNTSVAKVSNLRNALNFDGVDDMINFGIPNWTYSTQFRTTLTIECWFRTTDTNNQDTWANFVSRWINGGTQAQFMFFMNASGQVEFYGEGVGGIQSILTYKDTLWHHAAVTFNSGVMNLYIDGVNVKTSTNATNLLNNDSTINLIIGSDDRYLPDRQFRGSIADVRIWNVVRTPTEIFNNFAIQLNGNETGLLFYNKLDQGTVGANNSGITTTTNNMLSGGNTGTLVNFALSGTTSNWVLGPEPRITILGVGSSTINANISATTNYTSSSTTALLTVNQATPSLSNFTVAARNFGSAAFNLTAPTSNSPGVFTYTSSNTSVATISGSTVTVLNAGSTTITATQASTSNYTSGTITATFIVNQIVPTLSNFTVAAKDFASAAFNLTAPTSNSGGSFTYTSSNTGVATISGSTVTIVGGGTSTITATQASTTNYTSGSITATFTVNPIAPTITNFSVATKKFGDLSFSFIAPTTNSAGSFSYTSSNTLVATISGSTVTLVGPGTTTITSTQAATANYTSGTITATFIVTPNQGMALSGDGLVFALGKPNFNSQAGKVEIYSWNGTSWVQKGSTLNGSAGDSFGYSLSLSNTGNIVVIGAYSGQTSQGYAKVFEFISNDWQLKGSQINGNNANDEFTRSISLSSDGTTFAGGSPASNYVKIFSWNGSAWAQKGSTLTGEASSRYGESIQLSSDGSLIAIGAPNFSTNTGYTKVFEFVSNSWTQKGSTLNGAATNEYFGYSVSLSGTDLVVGAYGGSTNTGYLKYYKWINSSWQQKGGTVSGSATGNNFGYSVALSSNNKIATGAYGLSGNTGQVKVYNYNPFPSNPTNGQVFYNIDDNNLYIYDESGWVYNNFTTDGSIVNSGTSTLIGAVTVGTTLNVSGNTTLTGMLNVSGNTTLTGNIGIGQAPSTTYKLDVLGTARASLFTTTSDYRIKEDISDVTNEDIDELQPVKYKNKLNNKLEYGFIAHQVQDVFPEIVQGEKDGEEYQSINYLGLIPIMVHEIKQLKEEIRNLKRKLNED